MAVSAGDTTTPPVHELKQLPHADYNRLFAAVYASAVVALLHRHVTSLVVFSQSYFSFSTTTFLLLAADLVLAFKWVTAQALRMRPVRRREFPANLPARVKRSEFPALDVFICTADPYKEPPVGVVNTALSVLAYDYPPEKLSVYVSDDGGSALTLFAFLAAAKFAAHWLPFCKQNDVVERSPEVYFTTNISASAETKKIQMMYLEMKEKIERVVERGTISIDDYLANDIERRIFDEWSSADFSTRHHPAVLRILLDNKKSKDNSGNSLPNLIYVSREKSKATHHRFKAGALNVLLRVSAVMTNAPLVLTLDCDMLSTNPRTPLHVLCYYFSPPAAGRKYGFVQFPQRFRGINKHDIYAGDLHHYTMNMPFGFDGLLGPPFIGTGTFFSRRVFFGGPSESQFVAPDILELFPDRPVDRPINDPGVLDLAHRVAGCNYEAQTNWGSKMGFRYGSMVEDLYTGFHLHCEGWRSIFCYPEEPSFLGDSPISFADVLIQQSRWSVGALELSMSKKSPLFMGIRKLGWLMGLGYCHFSFWPIWSLPITTYAFLPQLALLNGVSVFPKVSDPWFLLYTFLFLGSYLQDMLEFTTVSNSTFRRWWNEQRIWTVRGLSCFLFGGFDFVLKSLGVSTKGFSLTSKVVDEEQRQRYEKGMFEFGVSSPIFLPMAMAALINLVSFGFGLGRVLTGGWWNVEGLVLQIVLSGFGVVNSVPIYEAMVLRRDPGKFPARGSFAAVVVSVVLCSVASVMFSF